MELVKTATVEIINAPVDEGKTEKMCPYKVYIRYKQINDH